MTKNGRANDLLDSAVQAVEKALSRLREGPAPITRPVSENEKGSPSFTVQLSFPRKTRTLACLVAPQFFPRDALAASLMLHRWIKRSGLPAGYPVIVAPFISPESAAILIEEDVGYVDLAGNFRLVFDQVHLECEVPGNPFRVQREVRNLFNPQSARVMLTLLTQQGPWQGSQLSEATGVSVGYVSGLKKTLANHDWVETTRTSIVVTRPGNLLDAWCAAATKPEFRHYYTALHGTALQAALRACFKASGPSQVLLAGPSAAEHLAPFVRGNALQVIATPASLESLEQHLKLTAVSQGANVLVELTDDDDMRFTCPREDTPGVPTTDAVSTYLSLWHQGERMQEAATHLRQTFLEPLWAKWQTAKQAG